MMMKAFSEKLHQLTPMNFIYTTDTEIVLRLGEGTVEVSGD